MNNNSLNDIIHELERLQNNLDLAKITKDRRLRENRVTDAKRAITEYASMFPNEVKIFLETRIGINPLSFQWVENDTDRCIKALKELAESKTLDQTS